MVVVMQPSLLVALCWSATLASQEVAHIPLGNHLQAIDDTLTRWANLTKRANEIAPADIPTHAWHALAFAAHGSTLRSGPYKNELKTLAVNLKLIMDKPKRPAKGDDASGREDRLAALLGLARIKVEARSRLLDRSLDSGWQDFHAELVKQSAAPLSVREAALLTMLARTMRSTKWPEYEKQARQLAAQAIANTKPGRDKLADAVRHELTRLAGKTPPTDLTLALCWPADPLSAPFHAFFAAFVTRTLPPDVRERKWNSVQRLIKAREDDLLWPSVDGIDREHSSAMIAAVLGMSHEPDGFAPKKPKAKAGGAAWR